MRLSGHHAVVTGGGTGIGAAIASALVTEGARITLLGRRIATLSEAAERLRAAHAGEAEILVLRATVTSWANMRNIFPQAREVHGPVSILVNNAGAAESAPFAKTDADLWRQMMAVNLDGVFHCCRAALPDLISAEAGRIVTIASNAGLQGYAYSSAYCAAKHGAVGLMRALAAEYAETGLTANAVCPGFVDTELTARAVANIRARTGRSEAEARAELASFNPSGRLIAPEEVAREVVELCLSGRNGETVEVA